MEFIDWLFNTGSGVLTLVIFGLVFFLVLAFVSERKTHKMYYNHEVEEEDDWETDEDDWEDDDEDEEDEDEEDDDY